MKMTKAQERIYNLQRCSNSELKSLTKAIVWAEKTIGFEVTAENVKAVYSFDKSDYFKGAKAVKEGWNLEERQAKLNAQHERDFEAFEAAGGQRALDEARYIEKWGLNYGNHK
ncbi:hypothetical protein [Lactococcus protaetiae]|uniref:Uncharacterized protein n=1 Tax=Lactococcus protaetiae TaxID=2592653 RepID=A0A514ZA71_9LACT|nr:hypothetical protein [Lactococcus protaetiae]QDK71447.1 hypothetical protein FLP15_10105 [Lactococcus protaetiae]